MFMLIFRIIVSPCFIRSEKFQLSQVTLVANKNLVCLGTYFVCITCDAQDRKWVKPCTNCLLYSLSSPIISPAPFRSFGKEPKNRRGSSIYENVFVGVRAYDGVVWGGTPQRSSFLEKVGNDYPSASNATYLAVTFIDTVSTFLPFLLLMLMT